MKNFSEWPGDKNKTIGILKKKNKMFIRKWKIEKISHNCNRRSCWNLLRRILISDLSIPYWWVLIKPLYVANKLEVSYTVFSPNREENIEITLVSDQLLNLIQEWKVFTDANGTCNNEWVKTDRRNR